jgi:hypothetical protein
MNPVLARSLTYLLATRRKQYRPLQWRSIIPLRNGIPNWVENLEVQKIVENGNEPVPHQEGNQKAPVPSYDRSSGTLKLFEFALMYQIFDSELEKAEITKMPVSALKVLANQRSTEEFLKRCSLLGHTSYGITGALKSADVPVVSIAGDWPNQDNDQILKDIAAMIWAPYENTKNYHTVNTLALPDVAMKFLVETTHGDGNLLEKAQKSHPGVRFVGLYDLRTAGSGNSPRAMALDSSADVLEMPMVHELQDGKPLEIHGGYEVLQTVKFGAPIIYSPNAIAYGDNLGTFT